MIIICGVLWVVEIVFGDICYDSLPQCTFINAFRSCNSKTLIMFII